MASKSAAMYGMRGKTKTFRYGEQAGFGMMRDVTLITVMTDVTCAGAAGTNLMSR